MSNYKEWREYCKKGNRPIDIPVTPDKTYLNQGWKGWNDFLGSKISPYNNSEFVSFTTAKEIVRAEGITNNREWREYCSNGKKPINIPSAPDKKYKDEWKGWADFLGKDDQ